MKGQRTRCRTTAKIGPIRLPPDVPCRHLDGTWKPGPPRTGLDEVRVQVDGLEFVVPTSGGLWSSRHAVFGPQELLDLRWPLAFAKHPDLLRFADPERLVPWLLLTENPDPMNQIGPFHPDSWRVLAALIAEPLTPPLASDWPDRFVTGVVRALSSGPEVREDPDAPDVMELPGPMIRLAELTVGPEHVQVSEGSLLDLGWVVPGYVVRFDRVRRADLDLEIRVLSRFGQLAGLARVELRESWFRRVFHQLQTDDEEIWGRMLTDRWFRERYDTGSVIRLRAGHDDQEIRAATRDDDWKEV